jgi:iron complex outermembrane receptor protein
VQYKPSLNYSDRNVAVLTDVDGWGGGPNTPQAGYVALPRIDDRVTAARLTAHREVEWGPIVNLHVGATSRSATSRAPATKAACPS